MDSKKSLRMELRWAEDDVASIRKDRDMYRDMWLGQRRVNETLRKRIGRLEREQPVTSFSKIRFYVEMTVGDELFDDYNSKDITLVNHWIKNQKLNFEDATFIIQKQVLTEVNTSGKTQSEVDYLNRPYYGYGGYTGIASTY